VKNDGSSSALYGDSSASILVVNVVSRLILFIFGLLSCGGGVLDGLDECFGVVFELVFVVEC